MNQIDPRLPEIDDCLYRLAVKAVIFEDGKLLLVKEEEGWWSLPGGGIDYGETVEAALKREIAEELGVDRQAVEYDEEILFMTVGAVVQGIPRANLVYRVKIPKSAIKPTDHVFGYQWYSVSELSQLYLSPSVSTIAEQLARKFSVAGSRDTGR